MYPDDYPIDPVYYDGYSYSGKNTFVVALVTNGRSTLWANQTAQNEKEAINDYISKEIIADAIEKHGKGIVLCGKTRTPGCTRIAGIKLHVVEPPERKLKVKQFTA